ncbi:hypothetical protein [Methanofollis fontis]|nr:hypothetical protein [Methanofollis fontis]
MRYPGVALLILSLIAPAAAAANGTAGAVTTAFTTTDVFALFIGGVIYFNVFVVVLYHVVRRGQPNRGRSPVARIAAMFFGILSIAIGSLCLVFIAMVLVARFAGVTLFAWTVDLFSYILSDTIPGIVPALHLDGTGGILLFGALGTLFFLLGSVLLVRYSDYGKISEVAMPTRSGAIVKDAADRPDEPLNPVLSYRVEDKLNSEPAADVKVVLKHRNGVRFHTKYTDFNGEVTFTNVEGFGSEYYAYVDGDTGRQVYRVIRT